MYQSQKSFSLKNFVCWTWFWQSEISKTLHLSVFGPLQLTAKRKPLKLTHDKRFLEENENELVNISIWKRSVKYFRFKNISSRFQVFFKKAILTNFKKFTGKQLYSSLFFDKVLGLEFKKSLANYLWATISAKYPLYVTSTSAAKCYIWP